MTTTKSTKMTRANYNGAEKITALGNDLTIARNKACSLFAGEYKNFALDNQGEGLSVVSFFGNDNQLAGESLHDSKSVEVEAIKYYLKALRRYLNQCEKVFGGA